MDELGGAPETGLVQVGDELLAVQPDEQTAVFFCIRPVATPHVRLELWDAAPDFVEDGWPERQEVELTLAAERVGLSSFSGAGVGFEFDVEEPGRYAVRAARTTITPADVAAAAVDAGLGEPASEWWLLQVWPVGST